MARRLAVRYSPSMRQDLVRTTVAALVTAVTLGCSDVPILPQWDADVYVPITAGNLSIPGAGTVIPANTSTPGITGPARSLSLAGTAGEALNQVLDSLATNVRLEVRVKKSANLAASVADTIFLAADQPGLATTSVQIGFSMAVAETSLVDTLQLTPSAVNLISALVQSDGTLWMQARGTSRTGATPVTIQATDSVFARVGLLIAVPVAGGN
jgi:hypothetical protein